MHLCSLPRSLRPSMLSLFCVSQFLLGSNLCCGFLIRLFRRGVLLFRRGALLIRRGVLLIRRGALLLCLLHRGGLLPCLLRTGGLLLCLLCRVGLLPCLLRTGGLLLCLLRRGGLLTGLLRTGGLLLCLLCRGGRLSRSGGLLSHSGGPLVSRGGLLLRLLCHGDLLLRTGGLLSHPLCLNPQSLHFHMDLALRPYPLFRLRSTALLDCIGASGSRSLWGGSVTNPVCGLSARYFCAVLSQFRFSIRASVYMSSRSDYKGINHPLRSDRNFNQIWPIQSDWRVYMWTFLFWLCF